MFEGCGLHALRARVRFAKQRSIDRAAGTAGAHQIVGPILAIDDVITLVALNLTNVVPMNDSAAAFEQVVVELVASDRMLNGFQSEAQATDVHDQMIEGVEPVWIAGRVEFQIRNNFRGDPPGT